ncbi:MAG: precorrin-2 dehydrogenase/sirohydrochlorin ferrochelatase family protein [Solirubrobacteraceae bacterium]
MTEAREPADAYSGYFPIALRMDGRRAVIIGGDEEAEMKARKLLVCRSEVVVIGDGVTAGIEKLAAEGRLRRIPREYRRGDCAGAAMVIVCDTRHGEAARDEAHACGVLVNVLDRIELCDFSAVAYVDRAGLQIAVHSSGKSAALARRIRERLAEEYPESLGELNSVLGAVRAEVKRLVPTAACRRALWLSVVDADLIEHARTGRVDVRALTEDILRRAAALGACADMPTTGGSSAEGSAATARAGRASTHGVQV